MNYSDLIGTTTATGSLKRWVNNSQIDAVQIVEEAEQWIWRRLRIRQMLTVTTGTFSTATNVVALPSNYVEARMLMITGTEKLKLHRRMIEDIEDGFAYDSGGALVSDKPIAYCIDESNILFPVTPNSNYPYRFRYYQQLAALSTATTTNILTQRFPRLLRCACMAGANEFMKNRAEMEHWTIKAEAEIQKINQESDLEMRNIEVGADYGGTDRYS